MQKLNIEFNELKKSQIGKLFLQDIMVLIIHINNQY